MAAESLQPLVRVERFDAEGSLRDLADTHAGRHALVEDRLSHEPEDHPHGQRRADARRVAVEREVRPGGEVAQRLADLPVADAVEPSSVVRGDEAFGLGNRVLDRLEAQPSSR